MRQVLYPPPRPAAGPRQLRSMGHASQPSVNSSVRALAAWLKHAAPAPPCWSAATQAVAKAGRRAAMTGRASAHAAQYAAGATRPADARPRPPRDAGRQANSHANCSSASSPPSPSRHSESAPHGLVVRCGVGSPRRGSRGEAHKASSSHAHCKWRAGAGVAGTPVPRPFSRQPTLARSRDGRRETPTRPCHAHAWAGFPATRPRLVVLGWCRARGWRRSRNPGNPLPRSPPPGPVRAARA